MTRTGTLHQGRATIDRCVTELREGGQDAPAYCAERDYREQVLGSLLRGMGRLYPEDTRYPRHGYGGDEPRYLAARTVLDFDTDGECDADHGQARRHLASIMHDLILAIYEIDGDLGQDGVRIQTLDNAQAAWCRLWPAVLAWRASAEATR